jgi:hypothetical protein
VGVAAWALHGGAGDSAEPGTPASRGPAEGADAVRRIEELETRLRRLEAIVEERPGGGTAAGGGAAASSPVGPDGNPVDPAHREPLRALVRELVREAREAEVAEAAAAGKQPAPPGAERKPPLSQFAAELDLEPGQRESVHRAVLHGQEGMIALLRTPTAGGRVPVDEILDALLGDQEKARPRMIEIFGMLATERVPGGEGTYAERVEALKREAVDSFRREFTPEQFKSFEKSGQDPLEIQVPDSPWIQVFQDAVRRRK